MMGRHDSHCVLLQKADILALVVLQLCGPNYAASVLAGVASSAFDGRAFTAALGFAGPLYPWKDLPAGTAGMN